MDLVEQSLSASAETGRVARAVELAASLIGQTSWKAETIPTFKGSTIATFRESELRQHRIKAALGNGQPARHAEEPEGKLCLVFEVTALYSQLIWTAMSKSLPFHGGGWGAPRLGGSMEPRLKLLQICLVHDS